MKKKILFVGNGSYKNLSDTFWRIEYLKSDYDVTYLGFKEMLVNDSIGFRLIELDGFGNSIFSRFRLLFKYNELLNKKSFDLVIVNYFLGVSLFAFLNNKALVDIRSSIIRDKKINRIFYNCLLKIESSFFIKKIVISECLRDYLNFDPNNSFIYPLGSQKFNLPAKSFEELSLLYIGTFNFRRIHETIIGFNQFRIDNADIKLSYYIIGYGSSEETSRLKKMIKEYNREEEIFFLGELRYPEFLKYIKLCNVGVSYIPITDYFNCQPPTKTFEYLVNGLCVIGTATLENKKVINTTNGVLIQDNPLGFKIGLEELVVKSKKMKSKKIIEDSSIYTWHNIVKTHTKILLQ
jgi:glycosyltransferase involved in cell wall biosynthesis